MVCDLTVPIGHSILISHAAGRGGGSRSNIQQRSPSRTPSYHPESKAWAKSPPLITTRRAAEYKEKAAEDVYTQSFLNPPAESEDYPVVVSKG